MKHVFLFGSGRDVSTRSIRQANHSRELQIRIGPWIIRPARRISVAPLRLEEYLEILEQKVNAGVIIVQSPDLTAMPMAKLRELIAQLKEPDAEALIERTQAFLVPNADHAEGVSDAIESTSEGAEGGAPSLGAEDSLPPSPDVVGDAAPSVVELEREAAADIEAKVLEEVIDAMAPSEAETQPEVVVPEELAVTPTPTLDAPSGPLSARTLPDGWKDLSNKNLFELAKLNNVAMPDKASKATLISTLEAWLGGN